MTTAWSVIRAAAIVVPICFGAGVFFLGFFFGALIVGWPKRVMDAKREETEVGNACEQIDNVVRMATREHQPWRH